MKQAIVDIDNKKVGDIDLADVLFASDANPALIYENVKMQLANKRAGSASTLTVSNMRGTTAKMYRQKGSGRARHGSMKRNIFVGGSIVHVPLPREYSYSMPKKAKKAGVKAALTIKKNADQVIVVDNLDLKEPKTKVMVASLKKLGVEKALFVLDAANENLEKSVRNIPYMKVLRCEGINVHDLIRYDHVIFTKASVAKVQEVFGL